MKIENPRTDIVSHKTFPRSQLIRLTLVNGELKIDENGTLPGRGFYIYKDAETIKKSSRALSRYSANNVEQIISDLLKLL